MKWNDDQIRAIETNGNVIVSAAAGAGKTSVLTERVLRLIRGGASVDRMLILTFTRAAAGEMKTRIASRLEEAALTAETDAQRAYLRTQAQLAAAANISTMHAFCKKVVTRHFFRVGLAPNVETMDDTESAVLRAAALQRVIGGLAETDPETFRLLVGALDGDQKLAAALTKLNAFLSAEPDPDAWLSRTEATLLDPDAFDALLKAEWEQDRGALRLAMSELETARDGLPPACEKVIGVLDELLSHARGSLIQPTRGAYGASIAMIPVEKRLPQYPKGFSDEDKQPVKDAKTSFNKLVREQIERYSVSRDELFATQEAGARVILPLFGLLRTYREAYTAEKRERAKLDFDDLEHLTIEILKDDRIAAEYRERFDYVIVDEYQDSNRVQEAILSRILRPDNAFFVGDVKQSIYRFRKAEPQLFLEKCTLFNGEAGTRVDLKQNFRSSEAVIAAVNRVFEVLMQAPIAGIAYDDAARLRRGSSETGGSVELHLFERKTETDEESASDAEAEARFVAQHIRERMARPIYLSKSGETRMPAYGDFAILLRSKKNASVFAETLAFAGIPCYAQLSGGYFDAIEVQLVMNVLRVLDNRRQDIPLLSVLRSPFFGFTDEELIRLRIETRNVPLLDCLLASGDPHVLSALAAIDAWRALSRRLSMEELLETILDAAQYRERMGALPGGVQRVRNLEALIERARTFDKSGGDGVHGFLAFMDAAAAAADLGASQTVTSNVVRIMTIHKSKGLEFPMVYLAGMGQRFNRQDETEPLLLHETLGAGLQFLDETGCKRRTYARHIIRGAVSDASWQEELRVLYVGMTRAKSELVMLGCLSNAENAVASLPEPTLSALRKANSALRLLMLSLNGFLKLNVHAKTEYAAPEQRETLPALPAADPAVLASLETALSWEYPLPRRTDAGAKTSVTALGEADAESFDPPQFAASGDGVLLGTRTHALLRRLPKPSVSDETLDALAEAVGGLPKKYLAAVRWFADSPLYARMCRAARSEREWSFVRPISDEPGATLLQGVIDACFYEDGAWVLLDYKTDHVEGDPRLHAERHRKQLTLYAEALTALTHRPVREMYVILLNARAAVPLC